jgi:hypothetical protein
MPGMRLHQEFSEQYPVLRCESALSWLTVQRLGGVHLAREMDQPLELEAPKLQPLQDRMAWATMTTGEGEKAVAVRG